MSNDLPADHNARRMNYQHSVTGGVTQPVATGSIAPATSWNAIGHSPIRGLNSPSQLSHTFGK